MNFSVKRKIDKLGRIVIQKDFRVALGVDVESEIEIRLSDGELIIKATKEENEKTENV